MKTAEENNDWINGRTAIISEMLDNPDENEIYPTTRCFEKLDELHYELMESYAKEHAIEFLMWAEDYGDFLAEQMHTQFIKQKEDES